MSVVELPRETGPAAAGPTRTILQEADEANREDLADYSIGILDLLQQVEDTNEGWLIDALWPETAYGVLGAEDKAGKSWAALDLAVSVATGTPWLGRFGCKQGDVLLLLGEGGHRSLYRKLDAICRAKGLPLMTLDGHLRSRLEPLDITSPGELKRLSFDVSRWGHRLVILDPLYLVVGDAKGSDLYGMGKVLRGLQVECQRSGSALFVVTHWNKGGVGSGPNRFSGVGPGAWGRVLLSAAVERRHTLADGASAVTLRFEVRGSEVADQSFTIRRTVRATGEALTAPLEYAVEFRNEEASATKGLPPRASRVLAVLDTEDNPLTIREIGDRLAAETDGPLKAKTIERGLKDLETAELVDGDLQRGSSGKWWRR